MLPPAPSPSLKKRVRRAIRLGIDKVPVLNRIILVSAGYRLLDKAAAQKLTQASPSSSWSAAAKRQARIYDRLLDQMRAGQPRIDFQVAADSVAWTGIESPSLLEVGCGNGYYSEILGRLVGGNVRYTGMDYSPEMVASARARYPHQKFLEGDTTRMAFADNSFDIVMDGVSLMHILAYRDAIAEIARVASRFVILNCLPVFETGETAYLRKYAYGQPVVDIVFGRPEIESLLEQSGLAIVKATPSIPYDVHHVTGRHSTFLTFLCEKRRRP
jgi:ubiquinone/menaquinone biosynthesis C-methylase UbiE